MQKAQSLLWNRNKPHWANTLLGLFSSHYASAHQQLQNYGTHFLFSAAHNIALGTPMDQDTRVEIPKIVSETSVFFHISWAEHSLYLRLHLKSIIRPPRVTLVPASTLPENTSDTKLPSVMIYDDFDQ